MAAYAGIPHPQKRDLEVIAKLPFLSLDSLHLYTVNSLLIKSQVEIQEIIQIDFGYNK